MTEAAWLLLIFVVGVGVGALFMNTLTVGRYTDGFSAGYASGKTAARVERRAARGAIPLLESEERTNG